MSILLCSLMVLAVGVDPPGDDHAADLKPVTVAVVDGDSGEPVTSFSYKFDTTAVYEASPSKDTWTKVESPSGTFEIQVPTSCKLSLTVKGRDHLGGRDMNHEFIVRSTDKARRVVVKLTPGITVRGTVRDAETKTPIASARVRPFYPTLTFRHDDEWDVVTDKNGEYELHGVDPEWGVSVSHKDFGDEVEPNGENRRRGAGPRHDVLLAKKPHEEYVIKGTVRGRADKPLEGVEIKPYTRSEGVASARDGTFSVRCDSEMPTMTFKKEGYITQELSKDDLQRLGDVVTLAPSYRLEGQVFGADGRRVDSFGVMAVVGGEGLSSECVEHEVKDSLGGFAIELQRGGRTWVAVKAGGHAVWEGWTDVVRDMKPIVVRLEPGVSVQGMVLRPPGSKKAIRALLIPRREGLDELGLYADKPEVAATQSTTVAENGRFQFDHVRPDGYKLCLEGLDVVTQELAFDASERGFDLGTIHVAGRERRYGRVVGRVFRPENEGGGPWEFAWGSIDSPALDRRGPFDVGFRSDEDGRFVIENVPVGLVDVRFNFQVFDVIHAHVWSTQVLEGRTTEVYAFDPERARPLPVQFEIGDGSNAQFLIATGLEAKRKVDHVTIETDVSFENDREVEKISPRGPIFKIELTPRSADPLTFAEPGWQELDDWRRIVLPDVGPGKYRLRVIEWLGNRDLTDAVLYEEEITVPRAKPIRVPLGAGCITGKGAADDGLDKTVVVIAVPRDGKSPARHTSCDAKGNFCVRYLTPGLYTLYLHDPKTGWSKVDDVAVTTARTVDVGEMPTRSGGTLAGVITFGRPSALPDEIVAVDGAGVTLPVRLDHGWSRDRFALRGLWPSRWTVSVRSKGKELATTQVNLLGTEKASAHLSVGTEEKR